VQPLLLQHHPPLLDEDGQRAEGGPSQQQQREANARDPAEQQAARGLAGLGSAAGRSRLED
jgi:hypothetical protein